MKEKVWYKRIKSLTVFTLGCLSIILSFMIFAYDVPDNEYNLSLNTFEFILYKLPAMLKIVLIGVFFAIGVAILSTFKINSQSDAKSV